MTIRVSSGTNERHGESQTDRILDNIIFLDGLLDQESVAHVAQIPFLELAKHIRVTPLHDARRVGPSDSVRSSAIRQYEGSG